MTVDDRRRRRFSEEFKRSIVLQLEKEEITVKQVSALYEVKMENVKAWLGKFGKTPLPKTIIIHTTDEITTLKDLRAQNQQLKVVVADGSVELHMTKSILKLYQEKYGFDLEKKTKLKS
ncbi:MAG: transposase [Candidatus Moraniibacteriota bacterium]